MFITKKHLSRRTFLRGVGATLALPLLESMVPARTLLARRRRTPAPRLGFVYRAARRDHGPLDAHDRRRAASSSRRS